MTESVEQYLARGGKVQQIPRGQGRDSDVQLSINDKGLLRYTGKEREHQAFQIRGGKK